MQPVIVSQDVYAGLAAAVQPTPAEVVSAKRAVLARLRQGTVLTSELLPGVVSDLGLPPTNDPNERYDAPTELAGHEVDRDDAAFKRVRLHQAIRLAIAELSAEGLLVPSEHPSNDFLMVPVHRLGHSGGERFAASTPMIAAAYRLTPGLGQLAEPPLLSADAYIEGLGGLLDVRARKCLDEALSAARRGLYLSAANLLAAVSEAAWYAIGEALRDADAELGRALDNNATAQVQRLVATILEHVPRQRTTVTELRAHAAYLRDLRNYGVHPTGDYDASQEHAFTEVGCLLLLMQTHRYLVRLVDAAAAAGADLRR